jgi:anterior pharynx defective protein 1
VFPLRDTLAFGLVFSVFFQELFRLFIYLLLKKADIWMRKLTENEETKIFKNKHILSYGKTRTLV